MRGTRAAASRDTSSARTRGRERLRLVLQPVARPDVADRDHAGTGAGHRHVSTVPRGRVGSSATTRLVDCHPDPLPAASSVWPNLK